VTQEYGLDKERLLVTVYSEDEEAAGLWAKIAGLPEERIIRIPTSDNFWQMGDTGPCGPCSEIFFDHGPHIPGGPPGSPDQDGDRFIEIWNLVFMQFEQIEAGERVPLPKPSIDTGMGLERLTAVLSGTHDNYDTDLLRTLIEASAGLSNTAPDGEHSVSHRVIADHLRATAFLIADGVLPSNEGRGYVLRRIMRRGMRHVHKLGVKDPMIWRLVPALTALMGQAFPELGRAEALIAETLKLEEGRFAQTLDRGIKLLEEETAKLGQSEALDGEVAFKLYDTFGFPLDLTQDILRGQGRAVDQAGFDAAMGRQRETARKAWAGSGEAATEALWFDLRERLGATEFLGYDTETAEGQVLAIVRDGASVESATAGDEIQAIVNQTPFYGESGGQVGDSGIMFSAGGAEVQVTDTQKKLGDLHLHFGTLVHGALAVGEAVEMKVESTRRTGLRAHHSATHLLHEALRRRLGAHVTQKGSLVAPDRLRFDFSHPKALAAEDLRAIEADVNARIRLNAAVETHFMTPDEAIEAGALALFGEKYGDEVRVVSMGGPGGGPGGGARGRPIGRCWGRPWGRTCRSGLLDGTLRRHPRAPQRRHRISQDFGRGCVGLRGAPGRGGHRGGGARPRHAPGGGVGRGGGRAQGGAGGAGRAGGRVGRRTQAAGARTGRGAAQAGDRRRRGRPSPGARGRRRQIFGPGARGPAGQGPQAHGRRAQEAGRQRCGGPGFGDRWQGLAGGRRDR